MKTIAYLDVDQKFVLEVASGLRPPAIIAEEYGYSPDEWLVLEQYDPFRKQVDLKKAELKASGYTFKMKAAVAAEDLLEDVYTKAKDSDSSFHTQLEALKFMARAAGIDAPMKEQEAVGGGFSISITIGGQEVRIGGSAKPVQDIVDVEEEDEHFDFDSTMSFANYTPVPLLV